MEKREWLKRIPAVLKRGICAYGLKKGMKVEIVEERGLKTKIRHPASGRVIEIPRSYWDWNYDRAIEELKNVLEDMQIIEELGLDFEKLTRIK